MMLFALWAAAAVVLLGPEIYHSSLLDKSDCQPVSLSICISRYLVLDIQISNKWNLNKSPCPLHYQPEFVGLSALPWLSLERSLSWISLYNFVLFEVFPVLLCHNKIFIYAIARSPHNIPPCPVLCTAARVHNSIANKLPGVASKWSQCTNKEVVRGWYLSLSASSYLLRDDLLAAATQQIWRGHKENSLTVAQPRPHLLAWWWSGGRNHFLNTHITSSLASDCE